MALHVLIGVVLFLYGVECVLYIWQLPRHSGRSMLIAFLLLALGCFLSLLNTVGV